ncbi:MAG: TIGR04283 family arsenosugar biosynthesis glycosyltransferase [Candidatus Omnitrophota bacterium]
MVSIIVPLYNEENVLLKNSARFEGLSRAGELIFSDGASSDRSVDIAGKHGKVVYAPIGRAAQMNQGAFHAKGDILLFLHADTIIAPDSLAAIEKSIIEDGFIGGCFTQEIDNNAFIYRLIAGQGNLRARLSKEFYGDQGIFVKKDAFLSIGGFPEVPILEDVLFTRKLRDRGKTIVLADKILVSARRWENNGVIRTAVLYNLIIILFRLKVPLHKIKRLYEDLR